jgi:hypothetical protein
MGLLIILYNIALRKKRPEFRDDVTGFEEKLIPVRGL